MQRAGAERRHASWVPSSAMLNGWDMKCIAPLRFYGKGKNVSEVATQIIRLYVIRSIINVN